MKGHQYHIVLVNLDPTVGSEIRKTRPCVIISPDEMNDHLTTVIVAPVTSRFREYPTRVAVNHTSASGWIALDQIRTIDKTRMVRILGRLSPEESGKVKTILKEMLVD
jgi:mRNA interferase MazF